MRTSGLSPFFRGRQASNVLVEHLLTNASASLRRSTLSLASLIVNKIFAFGTHRNPTYIPKVSNN